MIIEQWRIEHNTVRPDSSLGYRPTAPEAYFKTVIVQNMPEMISSPRDPCTLGILTQKVAHVMGADQRESVWS